MDDEITLEVLETRQAESAVLLLQTMLQAARIRRPDRAAKLNALTGCRLEITAVGPQVQLQLHAQVEGESELLYGATFTEAGGVMH